MAKLNINRVRLRDQRIMMRFERKYQKLIYEALDKSVRPAINNANDKIDTKAIEDVYLEMYVEVGVYFASNNFDFMDSLKMKESKDFFLNTWRSWMKTYAQSSLANKVVEINDTTRDKIKATLAEALDKGITSKTEIGKMIQQKTLGAIGRRRARTIAKTETGAAANEGKNKSAEDWAEDTGNKLFKTWVAGGSREPRPTHQEQDNGKAIPGDAMFIVGGEQMYGPHDASASAENVVSCGCTLIWVTER